MKNISLILSLVYQLLVVTRKGEVMGAKEYQATGGGNSRLMKNYNKEKESNDLAGSGMVEFSAHPGQKYGFDAYTEQKQTILNNYPTLNNGYRPAWKSVESFGYDKVGVSSREGLTFRDEMGVPAADVGEGVSVRGLNDGSVRALYAYRDGGEKEEIVGKLNVMSFDNRPMLVYIVPVNKAKLPAPHDLERTLNDIYRQAVTTWTVVEEPGITISFPGGKMTHGGSGDFDTYNADQKLIVETYTSTGRQLERNALYLFFVEGVTFKERSIAGFMPLQRQAGFIYGNPGTVTVAHELAHGAFNLRHTFSPQSFIVSEGQTQNLMDYTGGTELWQHQWDLIHNPEKILFSWSQDESEGAAFRQSGTKFLCINDEKALAELSEFQILYLPDGKKANLQGKYIASGFYLADDVTESAQGAIYSLRINGFDNYQIYNQKHETTAFGYRISDESAVRSISADALKAEDDAIAYRVFIDKKNDNTGKILVESDNELVRTIDL